MSVASTKTVPSAKRVSPPGPGPAAVLVRAIASSAAATSAFALSMSIVSCATSVPALRTERIRADKMAFGPGRWTALRRQEVAGCDLPARDGLTMVKSSVIGHLFAGEKGV
jgi:3-methyladenine DNA glycosylase Mpg